VISAGDTMSQGQAHQHDREKLQQDIEEAFGKAYGDWTYLKITGKYMNTLEEDWSLLAYACGCSDLYKKLKEGK
jgi:hypothetical protein